MIVDRLASAAAALVLLTVPLHAETKPSIEAKPPTLDIAATCQSAGSIGTASQKDSRDGCLRSEKEARGEVERRWSEFSSDAKTQCGKQNQLGGSPGYVEMVTCLELASGIEGAGPSTPTKTDPSRLTNPIEVLGNPSTR